MVCVLADLSRPDGINKIPIPDGQREFGDTLPGGSVPRSLRFNGGIVSDCPRFARGFGAGNTPYGVLAGRC